MKRYLALLALAAALAGAASEPSPMEITLANGFVMKDCTIIRWEEDTITVKYVGGTVPVRFKDIAPEQRWVIEAEKEEAMKRQAVADRKEVHEEAKLEHKQAEQEQRAAKKQAELDRKAAAIQQGLDQHVVVAGMTMDQVRSMFGPPSRSSSLANPNASEWWIYDGRGRDKNGVPCNLMVHFNKDGVVTKWNNTQH